MVRAWGHALEQAAAVRVLIRDGLLDPRHPREAIRAAQDSLRSGPVASAVLLGARRHPHRTAIIDDAGSVTFGELARRSHALAHDLRGRQARQVGRGRLVVGVLARDSAALVQVMAAAGLAGARLVLLNTGFAAPQLVDVVGREQVDLLIADGELRPLLDGVDSHVARLLIDDAGGPGSVIEASSSQPSTPVPQLERAGGVVVLTSGTTGTPRGAPRDRISPLQSAQVLDRLPLPRDSVVVMAAPVFHGTGLSLMVLGLALGNTVVLARRFDSARTLAAAAEHRAELLVVVPTMLHRLVHLEPELLAGHDLTSLQAVLAAGAALPPELCRMVRARLGDVLYNMYGSTEVGVAAVASPADLALAPGCVGRAPVGSRIAVLDEARRPVAPGRSGTVFVGSTLAFSRYTDGTTKEMVDTLMSTGDVGHVDEHGLLHIDGREDDMIVSGGENVYPGEVENLLLERPEVADVAVVGVADEEYGQRLRAVVVAAPGVVCNAEHLRRHVRETLARHKVPREIVFVDELPRNPTGKVQRRLLTGEL